MSTMRMESVIIANGGYGHNKCTNDTNQDWSKPAKSKQVKEKQKKRERESDKGSVCVQAMWWKKSDEANNGMEM